MVSTTNLFISDDLPDAPAATPTTAEIIPFKPIRPDRSVIGRFARAIYKHASPETFVSLRSLPSKGSDARPIIEAVEVGNLENLIDRAVYHAGLAVEPRFVFAPPTCTFLWPENADEANVACGLAFSVDSDTGNSAAKIAELERLLGPATIVVGSGGVWADPETGEVHNKLHAHWCLAIPTLTAADHARLADARRWAAQLIGSDGSAATNSHPLRWPGSVHMKGAPRLAWIERETDAEITLDTALAALRAEGDRLGVQLQSRTVQVWRQHEQVENDLPENVARFVQVCREKAGAVDGTWHCDSRDLMGEAVRFAVSPERAMQVMREHWVDKGTDFYKDGRNESWPGNVLTSYAWVFRQGRHGDNAAPDPKKLFVGVQPPPDEPGETSDENARDDSGSGKIPPPEDAPPPEERKPEGPVWNFINPADVDDLDIPEQEFLVPGWLAPGYVTMLYADGGIGKSLLALQLMTSLATGKPWLGIPVQQCKSIGLFCEDPQDELNRRQRSINRMMGVSRADLQGMRYTSGIGQDNTLMTVDRDGAMIGTPAYLRLGTAAREFGARLIIVDTAADTFGGNENDRREVRGFIGAMLGKMALHLNAAVLLIAQPSRDGLKSGRLDGGSTAWNNTARARWTLDYVKGDDGVIDPDERVLGKAKANYGTKGDEVRMRWANGAFVPVVPLTVAETRERWDLADTTFLMLLNRLNGQGRDVSPSKSSATTYAPKVFASLPRADRQGLLRPDFEEAQGRLFNSGKITEGTVGPASRPRKIIVPSY